MSKTPIQIAPHNILGLDVGDARIGLAIASSLARLPRAYSVVPNDESVWETIGEVCKTEAVETIVVGFPRGMNGQETAQTRLVQKFADDLKNKLGKNVILQDETLTSVKAESELAHTKGQYNKGQVDSLAAIYILEDFLKEHDV